MSVEAYMLALQKWIERTSASIAEKKKLGEDHEALFGTLNGLQIAQANAFHHLLDNCPASVSHE